MNSAKVIIKGVTFNNYAVTTDGKVYSLLYKKYLRYATYSGYYAVPIACEGKSIRCYVHRLVAEAYIPNPNNYPVVNHKDGNKKNNDVNNLEWCTEKHNSQHACDMGLRKTYMRPVIQYDLNENKIAEYASTQEASNITSIPRCDISGNCRGKTKSCKGFKFAYKDDENKPKVWDRNRGINQIDPKTGEIILHFDTVKDAALCAGVASNYIVKCCTKPDYIFQDYLWRFSDDDTPITVKRNFNDGTYYRIKINNEEVNGYYICPDGKVWSEKQNKYLNPNKCGSYDSYNITHNEKRYNIQAHREVAKAYISNPNNYPVVNHKDGNKHNNTVDNLEWCSYSQNTKHAHYNGLIDKYVRPVVKYNLDGTKICEYVSIRDAAKDVGVNHTSIAGVLSNKTKSCAGFIWEYKENEEESVQPKVDDKKRLRAVIQYSFGGEKIKEYVAVKEAAEDMNVSHTSIINACTGKSKSCSGFMWRYENDENLKTHQLEENTNSDNIESDVQFSNVKAVVKFDIDGVRLKEYPSVKAAADAHNTVPLNISRACRNISEDFGGFIWAFKGEDNFIVIKTIARHPNSKQVVQFNKDGIRIKEFYSTKEAADSVNSSVSKITDACIGKSKTSSSFIWRYKDNVGDIEKLDTSTVKSINHTKSKPVVQFDLQCNKLQEFSSVKEASASAHIDAKYISAACRKKVQSSGNYIWRFKDEEDTVTPVILKPRKTQKRVVQFDLQCNKLKTFDSATEASKETGVQLGSITACCRGELKVSHGFMWSYEENADSITPKVKTLSVRAKRVAKYDEHTGEKLQEYESATVAAKDVGTRPHNISDACTGKSKTSRGFVWKYV